MVAFFIFSKTTPVMPFLGTAHLHNALFNAFVIDD